MILPYIEQKDVDELFNSSRPLTDPVNAGFLRSQIPGYKCPSDSQPDYGEAIRGQIAYTAIGPRSAKTPVLKVNRAW